MPANDALDVVNRFGDALNAGDIDAVMALMTDDCLFENTSPFPDGEVFRGQARGARVLDGVGQNARDARSTPRKRWLPAIA